MEVLNRRVKSNIKIYKLYKLIYCVKIQIYILLPDKMLEDEFDNGEIGPRQSFEKFP